MRGGEGPAQWFCGHLENGTCMVWVYASSYACVHTCVLHTAAHHSHKRRRLMQHACSRPVANPPSMRRRLPGHTKDPAQALCSSRISIVILGVPAHNTHNGRSRACTTCNMEACALSCIIRFEYKYAVRTRRKHRVDCSHSTAYNHVNTRPRAFSCESQMRAEGLNGRLAYSYAGGSFLVGCCVTCWRRLSAACAFVDILRGPLLGRVPF